MQNGEFISDEKKNNYPYMIELVLSTPRSLHHPGIACCCEGSCGQIEAAAVKNDCLGPFLALDSQESAACCADFASCDDDDVRDDSSYGY